MQTSSRTIEDWLNDVRRGVVRLPRFQRGEVWTYDLVEKFLWAILKARPLGVFLVLEVDSNNQPFETRPLEGGPANGDKCRQHLLDGQQRLTALWRSFNDTHKKHTFYVEFEKDGEAFREKAIKAISRAGREKGKIGTPSKEFANAWIPLTILSPGEESVLKSIEWRKAAATSERDRERLEVLIDGLRNKINKTVLPFLALQQETAPEEAIDIFIETNRSSVSLTHYELAVAQMESAVSESLEDKVDDLVIQVPTIKDLDSPVGDVVLKIWCLLEDRKPTYGNYRRLNYKKLSEDWDKIVAGIGWTVEVLDDLRIWNTQRLPTTVPLRVLPAIHSYIPKSGTAHATAMRLVKKYLWWSFLTDRYERQANDRLKEDYDALVAVLTKGENEASVPAFRSDRPDEDAIKDAGWPRTRGILNRAILAACSLGGARDIASNKELKQDSKADHHHIFPKAVLNKRQKDPNLALNCMLLDPPTNKGWSKKWPGDFLMETIQNSGYRGESAEKEVKKRLKTHLLPEDELIAVRERAGVDLGEAYDRFLNKRSTMVMERIEKLLKDGELD